jgi:hypothetical protein
VLRYISPKFRKFGHVGVIRLLGILRLDFDHIW